MDSKNKKKLKNNAGFTLFELLVVIFIIGILTTTMIISWRRGARGTTLNRAAQTIVQNIRKAQNMAIASTEFQGEVPLGGYGLRFRRVDLTFYILFADKDNDKAYDEGEKIEELNLEKGIEIDTLFSGQDTPRERPVIHIVFTPPDPFTTITPPTGVANVAIIRIRNKGGTCPQDCRDIKLTDTGQVSVE